MEVVTYVKECIKRGHDPSGFNAVNIPFILAQRKAHISCGDALLQPQLRQAFREFLFRHNSNPPLEIQPKAADP